MRRPSPLPDRLANWLERRQELDPAAARISAFWTAVPTPPWVRDLLSGRQLGHPLHPAAVLAPAGALLSASALAASGDPSTRPAAHRLLGLGLASAVPAALAGWSDWLDTDGAEKRVGLVHAAVNAAGLSAYAVAWWRTRDGSRGGRLPVLAGATALGLGGWLGGHLAYAQGVGVDTTAFQSGPGTWTDVSSDEEITEQLRQVRLGDTSVLLTRVDGDIVALADRCTHRGGPLSDGERDGDCVVCPWHESRFDLATGDVRRGPATRPQPVYEVRQCRGRVEIRRGEERALRTNPV